MIDTQFPIGGPPAGPSRIPGGVLGKEDFLRLLITQLRNQDPLNPLDQNQFLAQTAQFSSLEQLTNISRALSDLRDTTAAGSIPQAAVLLGKTIKVSGRQFEFTGSPMALTFNLSGPGRVQVDVLAEDGSVVRRLEGGIKQAGPQSVEWDGRDDGGRSIAPGSYFFRVSAFNAGSGVPQAVAAEGPLTGFLTASNRLFYRMGSNNLIVRQEDIVDVR